MPQFGLNTEEELLPHAEFQSTTVCCWLDQMANTGQSRTPGVLLGESQDTLELLKETHVQSAYIPHIQQFEYHDYTYHLI